MWSLDPVDSEYEYIFVAILSGLEWILKEICNTDLRQCERHIWSQKFVFKSNVISVIPIGG